MKFQFGLEGLIFILIFTVIIAVPCLAVALLGTKLINHIGMFPSKSTQIQMDVCIKLLCVEAVSFTLLALFFHIFSE